jgi:CRP/FNR family transcriptional regulator, cyclic AMP receptor protein
MEENLHFLKETDLFHNLDDAQIHRVEKLCMDRKYKPGEIIFNENSRETELYLVIKGEVNILVNPSIVSKTPGRKLEPEVIAKLCRGQSFGEMSLTDEGIRSASAVAGSEDVRLLIISRTELLILCNSDPALGYKVMLNLCNDLSQKIRAANLQIRDALLAQKAQH